MVLEHHLLQNFKYFLCDNKYVLLGQPWFQKYWMWWSCQLIVIYAMLVNLMLATCFQTKDWDSVGMLQKHLLWCYHDWAWKRHPQQAQSFHKQRWAEVCYNFSIHFSLNVALRNRFYFIFFTLNANRHHIPVVAPSRFVVSCQKGRLNEAIAGIKDEKPLMLLWCKKMAHEGRWQTACYEYKARATLLVQWHFLLLAPQSRNCL